MFSLSVSLPRSLFLFFCSLSLYLSISLPVSFLVLSSVCPSGWLAGLSVCRSVCLSLSICQCLSTSLSLSLCHWLYVSHVLLFLYVSLHRTCFLSWQSNNLALSMYPSLRSPCLAHAFQRAFVHNFRVCGKNPHNPPPKKKQDIRQLE